MNISKNFLFNNFYNYLKENISFKFKKKYNIFSDEVWNRSFEDFINTGISKIPLKVDKLVNFINSNFDYNSYQLNINDDNFQKIILKTNEWNEYGKKTYILKINNELIEQIILNTNLYNFIKNYYNSDFWIRNSPILSIDCKKFRKEDYSQGLFHIDNGLHQISLMILLNDIDHNNTHMEYINKTHLKNYYSRVSRSNNKFIKYTSAMKSKNTITKIIGRKGDVYIFDAGNGVHRAVYGNENRIMCHFNFTNNFAHSDFNELNSSKESYLSNMQTNSLIEKINSSNIKKNYFKNFT